MLFEGVWLFLLAQVVAAINLTESATNIVVSNERLVVSLTKSRGSIQGITLDGQDLLGPSGQGLYLDCYCTPSGFYTPGRSKPEYTIIQGEGYAGVKMGETHAGTGLRMEFTWILRDGETGLHNFARLAYYNETTPFLRNLQELRTMFRPSLPLWTHLYTNDKTWAPLPSKNATASQVTVQDATWYLGNTPNDPYVQQFSDYFTKYSFEAQWRDHVAHGMWGDGSTSPDNSTYGAWLVMNSRDTYWGGPQYSDLVVDGIVYNYIASNHHGNGNANMTHGFDRTFGPFYYYFNKQAPGSTIQQSYSDAVKYANPEWSADFYDSITAHVPGYVPTSGRGKFRAAVTLPLLKKWARPLAVLTVTGVDYQDNVVDTKAYQYWADIKTIGNLGVVEIPRVKAGTYRLTIQADGLFGTYVKDDIVINAGKTTNTIALVTEPTSGRELWRIGTPDLSSGEFRHGTVRDSTKTLKPEERRHYFAQWDFIDDFPEGVKFKVGRDDPATDLNYVHWSSVGGKGNFIRPETIYSPTISNWSILFDTNVVQLFGARTATLTVQLAGAKTASGNTDVYNATQPYANLPLVATVNGNELEAWVIPYYHSSSCAVRSAVACYATSHQYTFPVSMLKKSGENELVFRLPMDAKTYESAQLSEQVYVQYDAIRLEVK